MNAYEELGRRLEGKPIAKIRTGAGYSSAHIHDGPVRTVTVRGHEVVRAYPDGRVEFDTCGYHTLTTRAAMALTGHAVWSMKGDYVGFTREGNRETLVVNA